MVPQSRALLESSLDACITSLSERQLPAASSRSTGPCVQIDCQVQRISFELSQAKLSWLHPLSLSRADANTKKLHLPWAPMVSSMTRDATSRVGHRSALPPDTPLTSG